jgi:putative two-component system response regulator
MIGGYVASHEVDREMSSLVNAPGDKPARLLIVDDEPQVASLLRRFVSQEGYDVSVAHNGDSAVEWLDDNCPDVAVFDIKMPGVTGIDLCRKLKADRATRLIPVVIITGHATVEEQLEAVDAGADDVISKPVNSEQFRIRLRSLVRMKRYTDDLESAGAVMMTLAMMIESRDGSAEGHCHRIANHAVSLGRQVGLHGEALQTLRRGGFLHDIGMLAIPDRVLNKPGSLEPEEYALVQSHTVIGESLISGLRSLQAVRPIVRHHHERLDGSGYPDGLRGDEVPLAAQIVGLVDAYESMTFTKAYQTSLPQEQALHNLRGQAARGWRHPDLVEMFADVLSRKDGPR